MSAAVVRLRTHARCSHRITPAEVVELPFTNDFLRRLLDRFAECQAVAAQALALRLKAEAIMSQRERG